MSNRILDARAELEQLSPAQLAAEQVLNQRRLLAGLTQAAKTTAWSVAAVGLVIAKGVEQIYHSGSLNYHPTLDFLGTNLTEAAGLVLGIAAVATTARAVHSWAREVPRAFNGANQIITPNETTR